MEAIETNAWDFFIVQSINYDILRYIYRCKCLNTYCASLVRIKTTDLRDKTIENQKRHQNFPS